MLNVRMSQAYLSIRHSRYPNPSVVYGRYHNTQMLNAGTIIHNGIIIRYHNTQMLNAEEATSPHILLFRLGGGNNRSDERMKCVPAIFWHRCTVS